MLNMFLDEANNERMHLLSFVRMRDPGYGMRLCVLASQAVVGAGFTILYAMAPDFLPSFRWIRRRGGVPYLYDNYSRNRNGPRTPRLVGMEDPIGTENCPRRLLEFGGRRNRIGNDVCHPCR
mmetsp:Transcript_27643/g.41839  ORF Transcript_27643/g.41839 Transcript_27643/m.41839 type:complete len:122 (+) Transcript_27643:1060-1425(+)